MTKEEALKNEYTALKEQDIRYNRVSTSRLLFYLSLTAFICFVAGCSFQLYQHSYKGKPDVEIQGSTHYTPEYK
ncbi:MAG: hypothetical protein DI598_08055 [Pseudopedobacter saltans]|uniref:Uncharacterized protein n=1 Tax=Pseudopedobacter saltans TaxID=151895 RepID=A0A2W5GU39_9SPHI|nr:MAG: hypothetical protein DI598_08055 [Pseudopedobacter saltans]